MKKIFAVAMTVAMLLSMGAMDALSATVGWYGPGGADFFEPVDDTLELTWLPDAADEINLTDLSLEDWADAGIDPVFINASNVVAWFGSVPADWEMTARFAIDGDFLYVAARIVDADVVADNEVGDPFATRNIVNYNTGDNFQLSLDFGNIIAWTMEADPAGADYMNNDKAVFYSVGFRGHGQDVCISVQECNDDHILGKGDATYRFDGRSSGARGKTFLTEDGWATEFCIPLDELFYDACYKTFCEGYNDMILQSIFLDEEWPLEIGMNLYHMDWSTSDTLTVDGYKRMTGAFGLHAGENLDDWGEPLVTWSVEDLATKLSLEYVDGMDFSSPFILTPDEEPLEFDFELGTDTGNVALGKRVSINNGNTIQDYEISGWSHYALTDGWTDNGWHSDIFGFTTINRQKPTILTVNLEAAYQINCVNLYPYAGDDYAVSIMPRAYSIEVFSVEDSAWIEVASDAGVNAPNGVLTDDTCLSRVEVLSYEFAPVVATRVRVVVTQESGADIGGSCDVTCIGEIEILTADGDGGFDDDLFGDPAEEPELHEKNGLFNVARGKSVTVNNGNAYDEPLLMWGLPYMTDGSIYSAWVNNSDETVSSSHSPTVLTVALGGKYEVSHIELYPYAVPFGESTMPRIYTVEVYSSDIGEWVEVGSERKASVQAGAEADTVFSYEFEPLTATRVRVTITGDSRCYMDTLTGLTSIGELAVWGLPAGSGGGNSGGNETETETVPESESETETETAVESVTETVSVTETETDASTETGAGSAVTVVGCASSAGIGAVSALMIAAAVLIRRKKE